MTIESENADVSEIEVLLDVTNIDEPIELTSTLLADSFAENIDLQSAILESTAIDPEGGDISFTFLERVVKTLAWTQMGTFPCKLNWITKQQQVTC